ncbi:MAG: hypothetical protein U0792_21885 [Gemmataceae bacterium]
MLRCAFVLVVLLCFSNSTWGASPGVSPDPRTLLIPEAELNRARDLVQQLGSEQYAEREQAEISLSQMGRLARPALLEAVSNDTNAEVRSRCRGLLPKATTLELKARLAVFLADAEGQFEHDLAGWNEFRSLVRNQWSLFGYPVWVDRSLDSEARKLFAEMISTQANRQILFAIGTKQSELGSLAANRRQELYWQKYPRQVFVGGVPRPPVTRRDPTMSDILTLLVLETQVGEHFAPPRNAPITTLMSTSGFTSAVSGDDAHSKVCRAVINAWFDTRHDPMEMYQALNLANNVGLPDHAGNLAIRLFQSKGAPIIYRGMAAATLVRLNNKNHIPLLEKAMTDNGIVYTIRKPLPGKPVGEWESHEIQLRDVALAVSLILTQQKPEDYGFVDQQRGNGNPGTNYNYTRLYLPEKQRDAAFAKWKEWREKNP